MKDFEEYIRQGEPSRVERARNWQIAIGLQQVDGLTPSAYLIEQANLKNNIHATTDYLMQFLGNLLFGEKNPLKNRALHIRYVSQSAKKETNKLPKSKNCTLNEHFVLEFLKDNPKATQKDIAVHIRKSERTVKTITANLQQKHLLERRNGKRHGYWLIVE